MPTAVLRLRGAWRAKTRTDEPAPPIDSGDMPDSFVGRREADVWMGIVPRLIELGIMTIVDRPIMMRYCRMAAMLERVQSIIDVGVASGDFDADAAKFTPLIRSAGDMHDRMTRVEIEFGMTPAARPKLAKASAAATPANKRDGYFTNIKQA